MGRKISDLQHLCFTRTEIEHLIGGNRNREHALAFLGQDIPPYYTEEEIIALFTSPAKAVISVTSMKKAVSSVDAALSYERWVGKQEGDPSIVALTSLRGLLLEVLHEAGVLTSTT